MARKKTDTKTDTKKTNGKLDAGRLETLKLLILDCITDGPKGLAEVQTGCAPTFSKDEVSDAVELLVEAGKVEVDFSETSAGLISLVDRVEATRASNKLNGHGPAVLDPSGDFDGPLDDEEDAREAADDLEDADDDLEGEGVGGPPATNGASKPSYGPTRYLKHFFTEAEVLEMRMKREDLDAEIDKLQGELDTLGKRVKYLKSCIDTNQIKGLELSRSIKSGSEMRDVIVEERKEIDSRPESPTRGKVVMVAYRTDTEEAIDWRELSYRERQGDLFDPAAATPAVTEQRAAN
jgi:hypothetical protein